jgi:hypothetical protein
MSGSLIPNAKQQFLDANGNPLAGGFVYYYIPSTTTFKNTYQNAALTILNSNPIILDSAGECIAYGVGSFRQIVTDVNGNLIWDQPTLSLVTNDASNVTFTPSGSGAVSRTVQSKLQEIVSVTDFMTAAQIADAQAGTASIDCLAAFNAAIASFSTSLDNIYYSMGGTITVPPGKYYLSDTLKITRNINLIGAGAPYGNDSGPTQLVFAQNKTGILIVDYRDSPTNKQGSGALIQNLSLSPKVTGGTLGTGVSLKTQARLINVMCTSWPVNGITINASTSVSPPSNANTWFLSGCTTNSNTGHGLYVNGADANAGNCIGHVAIANTGWGIYDSSFLGNTYVGCNTDGNTLGGYTSTNANARNMFLNCYAETNQPDSNVSLPSMVIGGLIAVTSNTPAILCTIIGLYSNKQFATGNMVLNYGLSNTASKQMSFVDTGGITNWSQDRVLGRIGYKWANLGTPNFFDFYDQNATPANGYARDLSAVQGAIGISNYYFGDPNQMLFRGIASAIPTSGAYLQGDILYNSAPTSGGYTGWICVTSGSPGVWKTFGLIS